MATISLFHPLMVSPFLSLATLWNMMHAKSDAMGMTHQVAPAATIDLLHGITALNSVDLADSMLAQLQGIRTSLIPPPPASPETEYPAATDLPAASAVPTASSNEAGGDANRAVGDGCHHIIAAPGHMEDGDATQEGPIKIHDGGGLPAQRGQPAAYPIRRHGHGDGTHHPHRGLRRGGKRPEYIFVS